MLVNITNPVHIFSSVFEGGIVKLWSRNLAE